MLGMDKQGATSQGFATPTGLREFALRSGAVLQVKTAFIIIPSIWKITTESADEKALPAGLGGIRSQFQGTPGAGECVIQMTEIRLDHGEVAVILAEAGRLLCHAAVVFKSFIQRVLMIHGYAQTMEGGREEGIDVQRTAPVDDGGVEIALFAVQSAEGEVGTRINRIQLSGALKSI